MEITDKGQGKSGGARVIIQVKVVDKVVYVLSTYDKAEYDTIITEVLKRQLKKEEERKQQQASRASKRKRLKLKRPALFSLRLGLKSS